MLAGVQDVLVYLIGHHVQVGMLHHQLGYGAQLALRQGRAAGVFRRVQDDEPGPVGYLRPQQVEVGMIARRLQEPHGDGSAASEANHGLVDGETGIGVDDLYARLAQCQQHVEHDGLGPGSDYHVVRLGVGAANFTAVAGDGLAQFRQPGGGAVVGEPVADGRHARVNDVPGRVEVWFADFQVDNLPALGLQGAGLGQHLKGALGAQVVHSCGDGHGSSGIASSGFTGCFTS